MLSFVPFRIDSTTQTLWRDDRPLRVRSKTFLVLRYLVEHAPRIVTRDELLAALWEQTSVGEGLLRGYIRELRQILGDDARSPKYIETLAGRGYRFIADVNVVDRGPSTIDAADVSVLPSPTTEQAPRVVGRDREVAVVERWFASTVPHEDLLLVTGDAGIGKTTVVDVALERMGRSRRAGSIVLLAQCIENHGAGEPYQPLLAAVQRLCRQPANRRIVEVFSRFAPMWLVEMSGVLSETEVETLRRRTIGATRERMVRELAEALDALGREHAVVVVIEDLQWSDPGTVDLVSFLARQHDAAHVKILGTCRVAEALSSGHPLRDAMAELKAHGRCGELALGPLGAEAVSEYIAARFPENDFPPDLAAAVHRNTDGNPLFMVALLDGFVQDRSFLEIEGAWRTRLTIEDVASRVPGRLVDLVERMIDRLSSSERRVFECSSVAGDHFGVPAVAAALYMAPNEVEEICELLSRERRLLQRRGIATWPDGTRASRYGFVHGMHRRIALERVPPARRELWHCRIAEALERALGDRVDEVVATEVALHFEEGGDEARARRYGELATQEAG